jgi:heavy metal sensor kinase
MMRTWPVRWRLTVWNATYVVATFVLVGVAIYGGLRFFLYRNFDDTVRNQANLALAAVQVDAGKPALPETAISDLRSREHFIRLLTVDGTTVIDTSRGPGSTDSVQVPIAIQSSLVQKALAGNSVLASASSTNGRMVYETLPVRNGNTIVGVLQVGVSRDDIDDLLNVLALALVIATPVAFAIAIGGGYVLAGRALRPVDQITQLASGIGANDLHARLALDLPDDELGRLARTFDEMLARIEHAFERQRRFTGDAAHELRTPLSLMRSQVDLALNRPRTTDEYRDAFQEFDDDLSRLTRLVESLLSLARSDANTLRIDRTPLDLRGMLSLIADQYQDVAGERGVAVRVVGADQPLEVMLDQDLTIQLLVNLVDNALANTPTGGTIELGCSQDGESLALTVRDTGVGIAKEHQEKVFERFYRVDSGRTRARGGNGLGLSICSAIVAAHGGTMSLTSEPGAGTTVTSRFPLRDTTPLNQVTPLPTMTAAAIPGLSA